MSSACMTLALVCGAALAGAEERQPSHAGKPLTIWVQALDDPDPATRHRASWTLRAVGRDAVAPLIARCEGPGVSPALRETIVMTLGLIGSDASDALPLLSRLSESEDSNIKRASAVALGQIDPKAVDRVLGILIALLGEGGPVAADTARDLAAVGPMAGRAVPALVRLLEAGDQPGRLAASFALGRIGPPAREAVPALRRALQDADPGVSKNAREALKSIESLPPRSH